MKARYKKLEDSPLWKLSFEIAKTMLALCSEFPEDENYGLETQIRRSAREIPNAVAEAHGSLDPRDTVWQLGKARSAFFAAKSTLKLCFSEKLFEVDPDLMVNIEKAVAEIDNEVATFEEKKDKWYATMDPKEKKK